MSVDATTTDLTRAIRAAARYVISDNARPARYRGRRRHEHPTRWALTGLAVLLPVIAVLGYAVVWWAEHTLGVHP